MCLEYIENISIIFRVYRFKRTKCGFVVVVPNGRLSIFLFYIIVLAKCLRGILL